MILLAQLQPLCLKNRFKCMTRIDIQVRGPGTIFISHEQGEATNQADGIQLTQGSTGPPNSQPYNTKWQGDLWYSTDTPGQSFVLIIVGEDYD